MTVRGVPENIHYNLKSILNNGRAETGKRHIVKNASGVLRYCCYWLSLNDIQICIQIVFSCLY